MDIIGMLLKEAMKDSNCVCDGCKKAAAAEQSGREKEREKEAQGGMNDRAIEKVKEIYALKEVSTGVFEYSQTLTTTITRADLLKSKGKCLADAEIRLVEKLADNSHEMKEKLAIAVMKIALETLKTATNGATKAA